MPHASACLPTGSDLPADSLAFYRDVLEVLSEAGLPFLVGGAYALNHYTGISRHTKDFDIFIDRKDYESIASALAAAGYAVDLTYPHWLAKTHFNGDTIDLVFSSGNGVAEVDQLWFDHAATADIFGVPVLMCPVEETLWSKAFIMERERFDGADVAHLILACAHTMDWRRLLTRFAEHWRLLLSHLVLFGLIYPAHRHVLPAWVMEQLLDRLDEESRSESPEQKICGGTLLSREQYLNDIIERGYDDARIMPYGKMSRQDTARWTDAIRNKFE